MDKIYTVELLFEDYESINSVIVGQFTNKVKAEEVKTKWEHFFKNCKIFDQPENWDPESDPWYNEFDKGEFEWRLSQEYSDLMIHYYDIKTFSDITISEFEINKDTLMDNYSDKQEVLNLMKEFDRNWKLNKIVKD
jgi:hypothetical protein